MSTLPRTNNDYRFDEWREDSAIQTPHDPEHPITYFIGMATSVAWAAAIEPRPQDRVVISYPQSMPQEGK